MQVRSKKESKISKKQIKMIWALWRHTGLPEEYLYARIEDAFGVSSMRELTRNQADLLIRELLEDLGEEVPGMITYQQRWTIKQMCKKLGWDERHFRHWLRKYFKVDHEKWLTYARAREIIGTLWRIGTRRG
jgi:AraC-like DNA-binding protein